MLVGKYLIFCISNLYIFRQVQPPLGYAEGYYGPWPQDGAWIIMTRLPPSWRSSRDPTNFHTVTVLLAHTRDQSSNPLMMGSGLEQILDWHCTCKAGLRTNASCIHRIAVLIITCATECFSTANVSEAVTVDTAR